MTKKQGLLFGAIAVVLIAILLIIFLPQQQPSNILKPTNAQKPIVTVKLSTGDVVTIELYPNMAPETVNNFIELIQKGFYDGTKFHRAVAGFVVQGGASNDVSGQSPGYFIKGEFAQNGFTQNTLKHTRGVLSMARSTGFDTAGSQFFICLADDAGVSSLDGGYAAFGKVISGMEAIDKILKQNIVDEIVKEQNPISVEKMTVDTKGVTYPKVNKINP